MVLKETDLEVPRLVLVQHHERARHAAVHRALAALELGQRALDERAHAVAEREDVGQDGPVLVALGHRGVAVAVLGVVDVRVDAALEDRRVRARLDHRRAQEPQAGHTPPQPSRQRRAPLP